MEPLALAQVAQYKERLEGAQHMLAVSQEADWILPRSFEGRNFNWTLWT